MEAQIVIRSREIPFAKMLKTELCAAGFCAVLDGEKHAVPDILLLDVDTCRPQGIPKGCAVIAYSAQKRRVPKNCRFLLCRPFLLETLFAMVRQVQVDRVPESAGVTAQQIRSGPIPCADGLSCLVGQTRVVLTEREYMVLSCLYRANGAYVTREQITALFPRQADNLCEVYISRLRAKLWKEAGIQPIHTERGLGYRMD